MANEISLDLFGLFVFYLFHKFLFIVLSFGAVRCWPLFGSRLNIKMSSYPYKDPHVEDKTVSRDRLIFNMGIPMPGKTIFVFIRGLGRPRLVLFMMTSWNGNIFRVTGPLCGEFMGHRWIHRTKVSAAELWCFLWSVPEYPVEQTIVRLVIWDAFALWRHSDVQSLSCDTVLFTSASTAAPHASSDPEDSTPIEQGASHPIMCSKGPVTQRFTA